MILLPICFMWLSSIIYIFFISWTYNWGPVEIWYQGSGNVWCVDLYLWWQNWSWTENEAHCWQWKTRWITICVSPWSMGNRGRCIVVFDSTTYRWIIISFRFFAWQNGRYIQESNVTKNLFCSVFWNWWMAKKPS